MMTAAMAFFSIALTLNLTGIKLTEVRAADLTPFAAARHPDPAVLLHQRAGHEVLREPAPGL